MALSCRWSLLYFLTVMRVELSKMTTNPLRRKENLLRYP